MPHFSLLVIGDDVKNRVNRLKANFKFNFEDVTQQFLKLYTHKKTSDSFTTWVLEELGFPAVENLEEYKEKITNLEIPFFAVISKKRVVKVKKVIKIENKKTYFSDFKIGGIYNRSFFISPIGLGPLDLSILKKVGLSVEELYTLKKARTDNLTLFNKVLAMTNVQHEDFENALTHINSKLVYPPHHFYWETFNSKEIGVADQVLRKYVDIEKMLRRTAKEAKTQYRKVTSVVGTSIKTFVSFEDFRDIFFNGNEESARRHFENQESVRRLMEYGIEVENLKEYMVSESKFVEKEIARFFKVDAVLMDKFYTKNSVTDWNGPFTSDWDFRVSNIVKNVDGDILLTVVDCFSPDVGASCGK